MVPWASLSVALETPGTARGGQDHSWHHGAQAILHSRLSLGDSFPKTKDKCLEKNMEHFPIDIEVGWIQA